MADWVIIRVTAVLKNHSMLLEYPIFEEGFSYFYGQNKYKIIVKKLINIIKVKKLSIFGFNVNFFGQSRLMQG